MPIIASPLSRGYFPKHRESSAQRSLRDSDATGKMWLKSQQTNQQTQQMQNALSSTNRAVQKLQRRILGMPPSTTTQGMVFRGEYSPTLSYSINDTVVISTGLNQGTYVAIGYPPTGTAPYTGGTNWIQLPGGLLGQWF